MTLRLALPTGLAALAALAACAPPAPFHARFAVRGRWPGTREIVYALESDGGPLAPEEFARAIHSAQAKWQATGCARFREAAPGEEAALVYAWKRGDHGACVPFGMDPSVAHAGPPGPSTFVHFDAGRDWSPNGLSLHQAALHETGHVLGLDHSPDEASVMYADPSPARVTLAPCDLAGIHSLYGGGEDGPGDLVVSSTAGTPLHLRAIAPPELTDWALFDTDGDGTSELLVWRTDPAGHGELWTYRFARGPELVSALGPLYGVVAPGFAVEFTHGAEGEALLVLDPDTGATQARVFDEQGLPQLFEGEIPPGVETRGTDAEERRADLDGDGTPETVARAPRP